MEATALPGRTAAELEAAGAAWTAREILQQPALWCEIEALMRREAPRVRAFLDPLLARPHLRIVLTGAGTSAYTGECLAPALTRALGRRVEAIATTDLVADPHGGLVRGVPTLLVSFARSGNSPESAAALELADACLGECAHLVVTCNPQGALYRRAATARNGCALLLPEAANDRGFAMTSSFTGMLLTAALAFGAVRGDGTRAAALGRLAAQILPARGALLANLGRGQFGRVVYLGSGALKGLAHEAALKMLELTDGRVVSVGESSLGFRHGPKTVLRADTLVVLFMSADPYTRRYDADLASELRREGVAGRIVTIGAAEPRHADDIAVDAGADAPASDLERCLPYALCAQSLALLTSLAVGVRPDTPSSSGTVSRVVQGVTIHPFGGDA
jgi:tagatose-6-phosphate ketose/aldose isomerase